MEFVDLETKILAHQDRDQGKGASPDEILGAEHKLGIKFTGGFRKFLERFGWLGVGPLEIYGIGAGVPKHLDLVEITLSERTEMRPSLIHEFIPIMNDGGGNLYCLDTVHHVDGQLPIVFWDHELGGDQHAERIAPSFEEWLDERLVGL